MNLFEKFQGFFIGGIFIITHLTFLLTILLTLPALNKKYPLYILSFGILFLFLALRYNYGNDYKAYLNIHYAINEGWLSWGQEDYLFKALNLFIPNFYIFIALISLFYLVCILILIRTSLERNQYYFAILLLLINPYLFLIHLSSIRQTLAICFVTIAVYFVTKKQPILYFIFILIASGFHQSALFLLPIFFLLKSRKLSRVEQTAIIFSVIILLVTPLFDGIIVWILDYFPAHYTNYYEEGLQNSLRTTLISSFFFFFMLFNLNKLEGKELIYGKLSLFSTIISLLAFKVAMLTRIGMYFDFFLIVTIPLIFSKIENKILKVILLVILLGIYLLRYWSFFNNDIWKDSYSTYQTILG